MMAYQNMAYHVTTYFLICILVGQDGLTMLAYHASECFLFWTLCVLPVVPITNLTSTKVYFIIQMTCLTGHMIWVNMIWCLTANDRAVIRTMVDLNSLNVMDPMQPVVMQVRHSGAPAFRASHEAGGIPTYAVFAAMLVDMDDQDARELLARYSLQELKSIYESVYTTMEEYRTHPSRYRVSPEVECPSVWGALCELFGRRAV